jgi:hypothetical protein
MCGEMFVEYRCTSCEKLTGYLVNTSSFLDINFAIVSVFVGLKSRSKLLFGAFFPNTGYARVVVFIKDKSFFTNIICNIYKKELKVSDTSFLSFNITSFSIKAIFC